MKIKVARTELEEDVLGNDGTKLHRLLALIKELFQLLARDPKHTAGHHCHDGSLRRTAIEECRVVNHKLALEREPRTVSLLAQRHTLPARQSPQGGLVSLCFSYFPSFGQFN